MTCTTRCYSHVLVNVLVNIHAYSVVLVSLNVLVRTTFPHLYYYPRINRLRPNFQTTVAKVYQSTVFLGCARRGQRAVGDPSTTGLCVYV